MNDDVVGLDVARERAGARMRGEELPEVPPVPPTPQEIAAQDAQRADSAAWHAGGARAHRAESEALAMASADDRAVAGLEQRMRDERAQLEALRERGHQELRGSQPWQPMIAAIAIIGEAFECVERAYAVAGDLAIARRGAEQSRQIAHDQRVLAGSPFDGLAQSRARASQIVRPPVPRPLGIMEEFGFPPAPGVSAQTVMGGDCPAVRWARRGARAVAGFLDLEP